MLLLLHIIKGAANWSALITTVIESFDNVSGFIRDNVA